MKQNFELKEKVYFIPDNLDYIINKGEIVGAEIFEKPIQEIEYKIVSGPTEHEYLVENKMFRTKAELKEYIINFIDKELE